MGRLSVVLPAYNEELMVGKTCRVLHEVLSGAGISYELVLVNDGSKEELMTISGIGDAIASQIIAHRNENGVFYCLEDLMDVNGIGNATFEKLKDSIYLHE